MRSSIPKVVGILMIIFASLGLLGGLIGLAGNKVPDELRDLDAFKTFKTVTMVIGIVGLAVSALHLVAGISSVKYKTSGPKLATAYGLASIALVIANTVVSLVWMKPMLEKAIQAQMESQHQHFPFDVGAFIGITVIVGAVFYAAWSVLVLVLMNRPAAKAACTN